MLVIPAIDLMEGKCVRLLRGRAETKVVYSDDPVAVARKWESLGAEFLHLVDLDGAITGKISNLPHVEEIARSVSIPAEFGGGVRNMKQISEILAKGVERVVLGTKACQRDFLSRAVSRFSDRVAVGIDAREGIVAVEGWTRLTVMRAVDLARHVEKLGVETIIFTDISADGTLEGPNFAGIEELAKAVKVDIIASGGIGCLEDIRRLKTYEKNGVIGVILGKALYEGRIDLSEAIKAGKGE